MTTDLARRQRGELATSSPTPLIDAFAVLDVYAGGIANETPRVESLATISAGYRGKSDGNRPGSPQRSRDGQIYIHDATGRAPGLKRALDQTGGKRLTISFPFDDPQRFIHCRFMSYTATELQAFGDETHLMVLIPGRGYQRVEAGAPEYDDWLKRCKVSVSVYFVLSEWGADGPEIVFPDGVGAYYRLRFTSRHSLRSILAGLRSIGQFTQGRIAGVPFDLAIDYREVADATGKKRTIPVWSLASKPPGGRRLTSRNFNEVMTLALEQGAALMLPMPTPPTLEEALAEPPDDDLDDSIVDGVVVGDVTDREVELIQRGGRCNADHWRALFFSAVRGSELDGDESPARAAWLREYTNGGYSSLADALHWCTEREAQALVVAVNDELNRRRVARDERGESPALRTVTPTAKPKRSYSDLFDDDETPLTAQQPSTTSRTVDPGVAAAAVLTGAPPLEQPAPPAEPEVALQDPVEDANSEPSEVESTDAQWIIAAAIEDPLTFARPRADRWYRQLVAIAAEREHPQATKVGAKKATALTYPVLIESIRVMLGWFPDVAVEQLDDGSTS